MPTDETPERRLTPTERAHELLKLAMERPAPVSGLPWFEVSQTKATGGATVFEWDVHVPVYDEYPTADEAFAAAMRYAAAMRAEYGTTNGGDDK